MAVAKNVVEIPEGIEVQLEQGLIKVKGPKGELSRNYPWRFLDVGKKDKEVHFDNKVGTAKYKALIGTFVSHTKNMIKGVQEPFVYRLKVCSVHFPMNVKLSGNEFVVSNFLGGKQPRKMKFDKTITDIKVEGDKIIVTSASKEMAGQVAAKIESLTRVRKKDRRIFQEKH
jgi:large subunit ribosomal protein L6